VLATRYNLVQALGLHQSHGIEHAANRLLIIVRNAAVFLNERILDRIQRVVSQRAAHAIEDVRDIKTQVSPNDTQVRRGRITCPRFIISLSPFGHAQLFGQLILGKAVFIALLAQSCAYLFGQSQNISTSDIYIGRFLPHPLHYIT